MNHSNTIYLRSVTSRCILAQSLVKTALCLPVTLLLFPLAMAADHFEVASVKPAESPTGIRRHPPGRIIYEGIELPELFRKAFDLPQYQYQVVWPEWVPFVPRDHPAKEKFDYRYFTIEATMPQQTTAAEFQLMLQNLLVERFGLVFHREIRQLPQYEISFSTGGSKMGLAKPVQDGPVPGLPEDNENLVERKHRLGVVFGPETMRIVGEYTVAQIAAVLSPYLQHPMVDRTRSTEYYAVDFTWGWSPSLEPPPDPRSGMTNRASDGDARQLFSVMERKLGLNATLQSVPTEFLIIDHLNHEASPN